MSRNENRRALNRAEKRTLCERDIFTKFIISALRKSGWAEMVEMPLACCVNVAQAQPKAAVRALLAVL